MSSEGVVPSRETVEALRDFAFAYYSEHEGPSESEHIARDLAQALDGDLSRAGQAAPDPMWNCMCGHCESWADHGGGMGWCSEHNTMTVSGHACKHARPKAEYAEPAGEAEAPWTEADLQRVVRERRRYWTWYDECLRRNQENASLREELAAVQARWANADAMLDLYAKFYAMLNQWQEFAERLRQDELAGTNERAEQAEARAQAAEKRAEGCFRLSEQVKDLDVRASLSEAAGWLEAQKHHEADDHANRLRLIGDAIRRGTEGGEEQLALKGCSAPTGR